MPTLLGLPRSPARTRRVQGLAAHSRRHSHPRGHPLSRCTQGPPCGLSPGPSLRPGCLGGWHGCLPGAARLQSAGGTQGLAERTPPPGTRETDRSQEGRGGLRLSCRVLSLFSSPSPSSLHALILSPSARCQPPRSARLALGTTFHPRVGGSAPENLSSRRSRPGQLTSSRALTWPASLCKAPQGSSATGPVAVPQGQRGALGLRAHAHSAGAKWQGHG